MSAVKENRPYDYKNVPRPFLFYGEREKKKSPHLKNGVAMAMVKKKEEKGEVERGSGY